MVMGAVEAAGGCRGGTLYVLFGLSKIEPLTEWVHQFLCKVAVKQNITS
jgi:hypothetical protein